jgi:uncharacterized protein (TIGR03437 family)
LRTTSKESLIRTSNLWLWLFAVVFATQLPAEPKWVTHQSARLVIGQKSFTRSDPVTVFGADDPIARRDVLGAAGGIAIAGDFLIVADSNRLGATPVNNRVLVYNELSGFIPELEAELPQDVPCSVCVGLPDVVLGQADFVTPTQGTLDGGMNAPAGVATDGLRLAVADTNNNRVLLWHSIPQTSGAQPDVVLGQVDLTDNVARTNASGMRGPQGVWIDSGKLFVADTGNSRILIWNSLPSSSGQPADVVVGQPNFDTRAEPILSQTNYPPTAQRLLDPMSVSVSNGRMFVTDLGFSRVMIYHSVPVQNDVAADVVIGQPDFETSGQVTPDDPGNSLDDDFNVVDSEGRILTDGAGGRLQRSVVALCAQIGRFDDDGTITPTDRVIDTRRIDRGESVDDDGVIVENPDPLLRWPKRCGRTVNFPRFALSDGTRLYIADSGNDRVLIFEEIPTENGAKADVVIGQPDMIALTDSDGAGHIRTPSSLAHDGGNLYVADPIQRRVLVFTPAEDLIVADGIRNGASFDVKANGFLRWDGVATSEQTATVVISGQVHRIDAAPEGTTAGQLRDMFVERINNREDTLAIARPINGPGTLSTAVIDFSGGTRAGDLITLRVGDRAYSVEMLGPPFDTGPETAIDRLTFVIGQAGGAPDVTVRRTAAFLNRMELVSNVAGNSLNDLAVSIEIPDGSPLIAQFVDVITDEDGDFGPDGEDVDGDGVNDGILTGETESALTGGAFPALAWITAVAGGRPGNGVTLENRITGSTAGTVGIVARASASSLSGGSDARFLPPGTYATMFGEGFSDKEFIATSSDGSLPTELGGVHVYVNGILAPISAVYPTQINFQVPWEVKDGPTDFSTGLSTYVWRRAGDGSVTVSVPRANQITGVGPGLFALPGAEPRSAVAVHSTAIATGEIQLSSPSADTTDDDESVPGGVAVTITAEDNSYSYTSVDSDTLESVRDQLISLINAGDGDPNVTASPGRTNFFSAVAIIDFGGTPAPGDVVNIFIGGTGTIDDGGDGGDGDGASGSTRLYTHLVVEGDTTETIRNLLILAINSGRGDPQVTARPVVDFGRVALTITARQLGVDGNRIAFNVTTSDGAGTEVLTDQESGFLERGGTVPAVLLAARVEGRAGNDIAFSATSTDSATINTVVRKTTLCCGNVPFSLITEENPAAPGETIVLFGSGLGFTSPLPDENGLQTGQPTPSTPLFEAPFLFLDFVSSQAGITDSTAQIEFVGLMPGFVGIYQINLTLFEGLPENPLTPIAIAQQNFISNTVTIAVKPLRPINPL